MRVLVSAASKYGSTQEIAEVIGLTLERSQIDVDVIPPDKVDRVDGYDAYVFGSAVYAGHWLQSARTLVKAYAGQLEGKPVWLFSSGPLGHPPRPEGDPADIADITDIIPIRRHMVFAGRLDKSRLSFMERAMVMALHAPEGDHRNWSEIRRFAKEIAADLTGRQVGHDAGDGGVAADGNAGDDAVEVGAEVVDVPGGTTEPDTRTGATGPDGPHGTPEPDRVIDLTDDTEPAGRGAVRGG